MINDRNQLYKLKVTFKDELNSVSYDCELRKQKMSLHEQYTPLNELEKKLATNEGSIFGLKQFIHSRTVGMNYQGAKNDCMDLVNEMNQILLKHM